MSGGGSDGTILFTCVAAQEQVAKAGLLIDSVRSFGGALSECEFWVVEADSANASCDSLDRTGVRIVKLEVRGSIESYFFARKVSACATVESLAKGEARTIVWLIPECLIVRRPRLFVLDEAVRAAVRPVHIVNVGSPVDEEPDAFWRGVYETTGAPGENRSVRSFVEDRAIRPYYNSAAMSLDPDAGVFGRWVDMFEEKVTDRSFQEAACGDELHRIFLHQAILSSVIATALPEDEVRVLPVDYGYPYNLQDRVPEERRAMRLDELTCVIYEERPMDPTVLSDIEVGGLLREWLLEHVRAGGSGV